MLRLIPLALMMTATPVLADTFAEVKVSAGKSLFDTECRRCHAVDASDPSYGPLLTGIVGRKAGSFEDYAYSEALAGSGIIWTPAALRAWMEDNDGFMPGTKMRHVGIEDPTVQTFILAYLETLTES
jgi:cytochrome c